MWSPALNPVLASVPSPTPGTCRRGLEERDGSRRTRRWCSESLGGGAGDAPQRTPGHPFLVSGMGPTAGRLPWGMMGPPEGEQQAGRCCSHKGEPSWSNRAVGSSAPRTTETHCTALRILNTHVHPPPADRRHPGSPSQHFGTLHGSGAPVEATEMVSNLKNPRWGLFTPKTTAFPPRN